MDNEFGSRIDIQPPQNLDIKLFNVNFLDKMIIEIVNIFSTSVAVKYVPFKFC